MKRYNVRWSKGAANVRLATLHLPFNSCVRIHDIISRYDHTFIERHHLNEMTVIIISVMICLIQTENVGQGARNSEWSFRQTGCLSIRHFAHLSQHWLLCTHTLVSELTTNRPVFSTVQVVSGSTFTTPQIQGNALPLDYRTSNGSCL